MKKINTISADETGVDIFNLPKKEGVITSFKNPPNKLWNKTFGGSGHDEAEFVQQTSDGGYIIASNTKSYGAGKYDVWLIKTDIDGNEEWNKTFGGPYEDIGMCVKVTTDGGFIIIGYYGNSNNGPYDVWLIKTDNEGNELWNKKYRGPVPSAFGNYVIELEDGYIGMAQILDESYNFDIWFIKTDFNGNEEWNKTVGEGNERANSFIQTSNGNFLIVGWTRDNFGRELINLIKTDDNGNKLWRRTYSGVEGYGVIELENGGYMIAAGRICNRVHLIKTDENGKELWRKTYYSKNDYWVTSFTQTSDGGYIITGSTAVKYQDVFVIKTDADCNKMWESLIGGSEGDWGMCIIESDDGNYVIAGITESYSVGGWDAWLIKMAPFDNIRPNIPSKPVGPRLGRALVGYNFTTSSSDPDGEQVYYTWSWGDGYIDDRVGPYYNDEPCTVLYGWVFIGYYEIMVKAVDVYGGESDWSEPFEIRITIPRTRAWMRFIDMFPIFQRLFSIYI
jgi:hypothetical protein